MLEDIAAELFKVCLARIGRHRQGLVDGVGDGKLVPGIHNQGSIKRSVRDDGSVPFFSKGEESSCIRITHWAAPANSERIITPLRSFWHAMYSYETRFMPSRVLETRQASLMA